MTERYSVGYAMITHLSNVHVFLTPNKIKGDLRKFALIYCAQ